MTARWKLLYLKLKTIFTEKVLKSVLGGEVPQHFEVTAGESEQGPFITLSHSEKEPWSGSDVHFRYRIVFTDKPYVQTLGIINLGEENVLEVPHPSSYVWTDDVLQVIRYGLRRLMVADLIMDVSNAMFLTWTRIKMKLLTRSSRRSIQGNRAFYFHGHGHWENRGGL